MAKAGRGARTTHIPANVEERRGFAQGARVWYGKPMSERHPQLANLLTLPPPPPAASCAVIALVAIYNGRELLDLLTDARLGKRPPDGQDESQDTWDANRDRLFDELPLRLPAGPDVEFLVDVLTSALHDVAGDGWDSSIGSSIFWALQPEAEQIDSVRRRVDKICRRFRFSF